MIPYGRQPAGPHSSDEHHSRPQHGACTRQKLENTSEHLHDCAGTADIAQALDRLCKHEAAGVHGIRAENLLDAAEHLYAETGRLPHKTFWWQRSPKHMHHLTSVDPSQCVHKAFTADHAQDLGWGQAVLAHPSPMGVTLPAPGADFNPEAGCTAIAAAAETAHMTLTLDNIVDRVYYSFKTEFGMKAYLTQLRRGPLRTTLACFRLGQRWLQTRLGRFGPHRVPYESRWCQHCASVNEHMVVKSEEHALVECPLYHDLLQQQPWAQH